MTSGAVFRTASNHAHEGLLLSVFLIAAFVDPSCFSTQPGIMVPFQLSIRRHNAGLLDET